MAARLWKDDKRAAVQKDISFLLSAYNGTGWNVTVENRLAMTELGCSIDGTKLERNVVMQVLQQMIAEQKTSIDDFEIVLEQVVHEHEHRRRAQVGKWTFFIPIELDVAADIPLPTTLRVFGRDFVFQTQAAVREQMDAEALGEMLLRWKFYNSWEDIHLPAWFISISTYEAEWNAAWKDIEPAYDVFRGLIEFTLCFGPTGWSFPQREEPRRKIPHPLWMIASKGRLALEPILFEADEYPLKERFTLTPDWLNAILENGKALRELPAKNSTLSVLADALRLYAIAMDARSNYACFLGLWQMVEAITRSETTRGKSDEVVSRLSWHRERMKLPTSGYAAILKRLADKRNNLVHRGIHDITHDDVMFMKFFGDIVLVWLLGVYTSLPTKTHLDEFYRLRSQGKYSVRAAKETAQYLEDFTQAE